MTGRVVSQNASGKTQIDFGGKIFTLNVKNASLEAGLQVTARLSADQIVLETIAGKRDSGARTEASQSGLQRSNPGSFSQPAETIGRALIQAGIPFDRAVVDALIQVIPNAQTDQIGALIFLFSRGLPINASIAALIAHLFSPRPKLSEHTERVLSRLRSVESRLEHEPAVTDDQRDSIRRLRQRFEQLVQIESLAGPEDEEDTLEALLRGSLRSAESVIIEPQNQSSSSLNETVARLLLLLLEMQPSANQSRLADIFQRLLDDTTALHESLIRQLLQQVPPQGHDQAGDLFVQIPVHDRNGFKEIEFRYRPHPRKKGSGRFDVRLDLSAIGPICCSITWEEPALTVEMLAATAEIKEWIEQYLDELQSRLHARGFQRVAMKIVAGEVPKTLRPEEPNDSSRSWEGLDIRV